MWKEWRHTRPPACPDQDWQEKWAPPCPDGNPQRLLEILGFRLKGEDYLQFRVVLRRPCYEGLCQLIVDEHPDRIYVRAIACLPDLDEEDEEVDANADTQASADKPDPPDSWWEPIVGELDCGYTWWLDAPLGERVIIDVDTGRELPLFILRLGTDDTSVYVPRPQGSLWPPDDLPEAG
jgi:hypothetical protein